MLKSFTRLLAGLLAAIGFSLPAAASTFSIDYTDLWGGGQPAPTENGWGLNLIQQGDVIFGTMFVYGSDGTARWFSVTLLPTGGGSTTWSGPLDRTTGSFYGSPWNNAAVTHSQVGTMTVTFANQNAGTLNYSVDGVPVNKAISRFPLKGPNLQGNYFGGATARCTNGTGNILIFEELTVTQNNLSVTMRVDFSTATGSRAQCTYTGTLTIQGRTGNISGTYNCVIPNATGNSGTFTIGNIETSINGFNGTYSATDQFCTANGFFGGVKDVR